MFLDMFSYLPPLNKYIIHPIKSNNLSNLYENLNSRKIIMLFILSEYFDHFCSSIRIS